jgi:putative spermidine/putrescine transport system permease protein
MIRSRNLAGTLFLVFVTAVYVFLMAPIVLIVILSLNSGEFLLFPIEGLSLRWFGELYRNQQFVDAIINSILIASIATLVSGILGTAAALYCARHAGRWQGLLRLYLMSPLLIPEILTAIALLFYMYQIGIGTKYSIGLQIGHIVITLPYVFMNVAASLFNFDNSVEEAARSLGASPFKTFRRVTLPLIKPGVITGCLFAFIISFDIFNISLLLKGIGTTTLPIQLFDYLRWDFDPTAAAVSSISIIMTLVAILILDRFVGLRSLRF